MNTTRGRPRAAKALTTPPLVCAHHSAQMSILATQSLTGLQVIEFTASTSKVWMRALLDCTCISFSAVHLQPRLMLLFSLSDRCAP